MKYGCLVNEFHVALVHLVKRAYPTASAREVINYVQELLAAYLEEDLLPVCGPRRTFMMDNLKAHVTPRALQVMIQAGHRPLARPPYSPWLAPIEFIFGLMEAHLRRMQYIITKQNFRRCIIAAFRAATTPANCRAVFDHCGL